MALTSGETTQQTQDQRWTQRVSDLLLNKTIVEVCVMTNRAVMFRLNTGEWVFTTHKQLSTIPALSALGDQL